MAICAWTGIDKLSRSGLSHDVISLSRKPLWVSFFILTAGIGAAAALCSILLAEISNTTLVINWYRGILHLSPLMNCMGGIIIPWDIARNFVYVDIVKTIPMLVAMPFITNAVFRLTRDRTYYIMSVVLYIGLSLTWEKSIESLGICNLWAYYGSLSNIAYSTVLYVTPFCIAIYFCRSAAVSGFRDFIAARQSM
jgi:hypothetical protein